MDDRRTVLKRDQVRAGPPMSLEQASHRGGAAAAVVARIVAQETGGVTLEVTCECGRRTYVRCEYAAPPTPAGLSPIAPRRTVVEPTKQGGAE